MIELKTAMSTVVQQTPKRLLIDVTRVQDTGLHSGIQRVVRGLYRGAMSCSADHATSVHAVRYRGAQWFDVGPLPPHPLETGNADGCKAQVGIACQAPALLRPRPGDVLLLADASWYGNPWPAVDALQRTGAGVVGFVHDLLPLQQPQWFRPGVGERFSAHLSRLLTRSSHLFTASEHVRRQVEALADMHTPVTRLAPAGALPAPLPSAPLPAFGPFFLCVATLEPRKQHGLLLNAMEAYWAGGGKAALVLVGAPGWCNEPLLARVRNHVELGNRLHWLPLVNDAELAGLYRRASALVYLSRAEGFGLPVLEARDAGCPVIASDIPPLHEAGGAWPLFVNPSQVDALSAALHAPPLRDKEGSRTRRSWEQVASAMLAYLPDPVTHHIYEEAIAP